MVLDGFFNAIHCSLNYLLEFTDAKHNQAPLFEAKLELQQPDMVFIPSLDFGISDGFYDLVEGIVSDIYKMASLVKRLAEHGGSEHYQVYNQSHEGFYIWSQYMKIHCIQSEHQCHWAFLLNLNFLVFIFTLDLLWSSKILHWLPWVL